MSSSEFLPLVFLSSFFCCFCLRFSAFFFSISLLLNDAGFAIFFCLCEYCYTGSGVCVVFVTLVPVCIVYMFVSGCLYRKPIDFSS